MNSSAPLRKLPAKVPASVRVKFSSVFQRLNGKSVIFPPENEVTVKYVTVKFPWHFRNQELPEPSWFCVTELMDHWLQFSLTLGGLSYKWRRDIFSYSLCFVVLSVTGGQPSVVRKYLLNFWLPLCFATVNSICCS